MEMQLKIDGRHCRRKRNIVTFVYNMAIWAVEASCTVLAMVCGFINFSPKATTIVMTIYLLATCSVSPSLYLLGMKHNLAQISPTA